MGVVIGPFSRDDFITMQQLKLDLWFTRNSLKGHPDFELMERDVSEKLQEYLTRKAA